MSQEIEKIAFSKYPGDDVISKIKREVFIETIKSNDILIGESLQSFTPIPESDFKELFNLQDDDKVDDSTLLTYSKIVVGSYLLHKEIFTVVKLAEIQYKGKLVSIKNNLYDSYNCYWREAISGLGSYPLIDVVIKFDNRDNLTSFWGLKTWEDNELKLLMQESYNICTSYIEKINNEYRSNYNVSFHYTLDKWKSNHWFYRMYNIEFNTKLTYKDKDGCFKFIQPYEIKQSITQLSNVWLGKLPVTLNNLIKSINIIK